MSHKNSLCDILTTAHVKNDNLLKLNSAQFVKVKKMENLKNKSALEFVDICY